MSVQGMDELSRRLQALGANASVALGKAVLAGGFVLEGKIKKSITAQKHGHQYGKHTASAHGEPPAVLTGNLLNGIQTVPLSSSPNTAAAAVIASAEYARPLEFGTSHFAERPFMRPAADDSDNREKVSQAASATLLRAVNEASNA